MKKKKPQPPSQSEGIPIGTPVILRRPNLWAGLQGTVESFGGIFHIIRVKYPGGEQTFPVDALPEEIEVLSETKELSK